MRRTRRSHPRIAWHRAAHAGLAGLTALALSGCGGPHSAFADPASEAAAAIAWLWWVLLVVTGVVFLVVLAGWTYALRRRRPSEGMEGEGRSLLWVLVAGAIVPAVILLGLTVATIRTSGRIAGAAAAPNALLIEVVGHQFWWEARYPESGAVTANEVHIPAERPVRVRLTTNDVIHSLWVPRLHGKLDLTPGRATELLLHADEPGVYRGFCAEFCGEQHALMGLRVVAQPAEEFARWLAHNAAPTPGPGGDPLVRRGEEVFVRSDCHLCHRVRGAAFPQPTDDVGPDLTHLASRETLAAVTVENTPGNLAAWVLDPHGIKPGVRMPATPLSADDLSALVRYLESLR